MKKNEINAEIQKKLIKDGFEMHLKYFDYLTEVIRIMYPKKIKLKTAFELVAKQNNVTFSTIKTAIYEGFRVNQNNKISVKKYINILVYSINRKFNDFE